SRDLDTFPSRRSSDLSASSTNGPGALMHRGRLHQRSSVVPPVSSAESSIFSPTFCTSWPAPRTVLQAVKVPAVNMASSSRAVKRSEEHTSEIQSSENL